MNLQTFIRTKRRSLSLSLCYLISLQLCLQTFTIAPVNANLDFWTKLKLLGLLALSKKISILPIPIALPIPIHIEDKEEVVYLKAPPPVSSAYSYSSPMMESYSHVVPRYVRPPKPSSLYSPSKMHHHHHHHHDIVGHASELVPVVAEASAPRYGERIVPGAQPAPPAGRPAKPIVNRQRVPHRTRVVVRPRTQSNVEYYQPTPTTQPPPPPPSSSAPIDNDYYKSPYEPEVSKPQVDSIAAVPMKHELTDQDIAQAETPKQPLESGLPENLLKYIRQVQGLTEKGQNEASGQLSPPVSDAVQPTSDSADSENGSDKWRIIGSNSSDSVPLKPSGQPESTAGIAQLPPQQSAISIQHQQHVSSIVSSRPVTPITSPIQNHWQQNFHSVGVSSPNQYPASEYVYRPPELKVMTNLPRYNPKLDQVRSAVNKPIISPLRQSFLSHDSSSNQATQSFTNSAPVSLQPTQFLYTVTHNNPPSTPFSSYSPPNQYPNLENFGLTSFRQSQLKPNQSAKPSSYLPSLSASASVESAKWIKPAEKGHKSKFFNNFGHRLSQIF